MSPSNIRNDFTMDVSYLVCAGRAAIQLSKHVSSLRDKLKYFFFFDDMGGKSKIRRVKIEFFL